MTKRIKKFKKPNKLLIFSILLICFGIGIFLIKKTTQVAAWFDDNWFYRNALTYSNSGSAISSERKIKFDIDTAALITAGKMQADCDDARFTDKNGAQLEFFIDTNTADCNNASTDFYVKVPSVLAGSQVIYFYYGNASAVSVKKNDFFADGTTGVGLKGYWPMDETSANTCTSGINDTCDYALTNDGAWNGNATSTTGKMGSAITLDGTGDYINMGDRDSLEFGSEDFSFSAWVKTTQDSQYIGLLGKLLTGNETGYGWENNSNKLALWVNGVTRSGNSSINTGAWIHLVTTVDRDGNTVFYINGVQDHSLASLTYTDATSSDFWIGGWGNTSYLHNGQLDDVRIYRKVLTTDDISRIYNSGSGSSINVPLTFSPTSGPTAGTEEKSEAPVAYWKFDEGYGTTTQDSSSNNNDGTITGATWQNEEMCVSGKCLYFDGTNDYIDVGLTNSLNTPSWTVEAWVKANNRNGIPILTWSSTNQNFPSLALNLSSSGQPIIYLGSNNYRYFSSSAWDKLKDGNWHHVAFTISDSANSSITTAQMYVDGTSQGLGISTTSSGAQGTKEDFEIGKGTFTFYKGFMDEFRVFNYVRTPNQIKASYNAGKAHAATSEGTKASFSGADANGNLSNGLVGYWKMDESAGGTAVDSSGNSNTGTYTNGATNASGKFGNGGSFDGTDDYIPLTKNSLYNKTSGTISTWFKTTDTNGGIISEYNNTSSYAFILAVINSKLVGCIATVDGDATCKPTSQQISSTTNVNDGAWHHATITLNDKGITMYLDGQLTGSYTRTGTIPTNYTDKLLLGLVGFSISGAVSAQTPAGYLSGSIDETRIYNRALSPAEVRQLYEFAPGPIAEWNFDDPSTSSGQAVPDISGNGNTGTLGATSGVEASDPTWSNGKHGKALKFDGVDDYVAYAAIPSITSMTWNGWYNTRNGASGQYLGGANPSIYLRFGATCDAGKLGAGLNDGSWRELCSSTTLANNTWYFVSYTWDASSKAHKLFINGKLEAQSTLTGTLTATTNFVLGTVPWSLGYTGSSFDGNIDNVAIYNYARTQKQILEDMNGSGPANRSPIAYYKFDEGQGTTANNSGIGGSSLNGTLTNMASPATSTSGWTNDGKVGKGLTFDGTNDYVTVADNASLRITGPITLGAWIYPTALATGTPANTIISKYDDALGQRSYLLYLTSNNQLNLQLSPSCASSGAITLSGGTVSLNQWSHVIGKYDGTTMYLYINGKQVTSTTGPTSICSGGAAVAVGARYGSGNPASYFTGRIDTPKIYNYALTEEEVKQEFNQGVQTSFGSDKIASATLAYDTFSTAGATSTESPSLPWTGATWTVSGGTTYNTPTLGSEQHTASNAASDPNGNESNSTNGWYNWTYASITSESDSPQTGAYSLKATNTTSDTHMSLSITPPLGTWTYYNLWAKKGAQGTHQRINLWNSSFAGSFNNIPASWTNYSFVGRNLTNNTEYLFIYPGTNGGAIGDEIYVDNVSVKYLTLSSLFRTISSNTADVTVQADVTFTSSMQAGLVINLDSTSSPANFVIAYISGNSANSYYVRLDKVVAGVYTNLINTAITYSANAPLKVIKNGTSYSVYYNGTQVGTTQTISDAGIIGNTKHGLFSTYSGNTFDNFSLKSQAKDTAYCVPGSSDYCAPPVAEWKFDEGTGTSTYDTSGNNNTGTLTSGPIWTNGKYGKALKFNGSTQKVTAGNATGLQLSNGTVEAWIKTSDAGTGYRAIVSKQTAYSMFLVDNVFGTYDWGTNIFRTSGVNLADNAWHHVVASFQSGVSNGTILYVDGVPKLTTTISVTTPQNVQLLIGEGGTGSQYFTGMIDDARIYNYIRTPAQIAWDYNKGGPVAHYRLDECEGTIAHDSSGNGYNGTITIGATSSNTSAGTCTGSSTEAWKNGASGKYSSSLSFDGTDDIISGTNSALTSTSYTVSAWVKPFLNTQDLVVFSTSDLGINFQLTSGGFRIQTNTGLTTLTCSVTTNLSTSSWQQITGSFDQSANQYKVYLNGKLMNTCSTTGTKSATGTTWYIGRQGDSNTRLFRGQLDDIKVYNYALTDEQVKTDYNGGAVRFGD